MALIQSRFIYYAIFPAAQRQEICLKFAIRTLSWQSCQSWQTTWLIWGRGAERNRKRNTQLQEAGTTQTRRRRSQNRTKKTGANKWKYIYIRIYFVWAPKILCNKNANDARTSADSFRLSLDSGHNLCSYAYLLFALDAEWWIEVDGGWRMEGPEKSSTCCRRQPLLILLTHLSQFPFTVCRRARWFIGLPDKHRIIIFGGVNNCPKFAQICLWFPSVCPVFALARLMIPISRIYTAQWEVES